MSLLCSHYNFLESDPVTTRGHLRCLALGLDLFCRVTFNSPRIFGGELKFKTGSGKHLSEGFIGGEVTLYSSRLSAFDNFTKKHELQTGLM